MIIIYCPECDNEVNENDKFCNNCGENLKLKVNDGDNDNNPEKQNNKNPKKKGSKSNLINEKLTFIDYLAKFIIIIFALFFPPIGILGIFKTKYFSKKSKIVTSIWLGLFLIMIFNIRGNENDSNLATQQTQEVVEDNTEKRQSILAKMIYGSDKEKGNIKSVELNKIDFKEAIMYIAEKEDIKLIDASPEFLNTEYPFYESEENNELYFEAKAKSETESGMLMDLMNFLKPVSRVNNLSDRICFVWKGGIKNKYGETSLGNWMIYTISKEDLRRINWNNFYYSDLPSLDKYYYIHHSFRN